MPLPGVMAATQRGVLSPHPEFDVAGKKAYRGAAFTRQPGLASPGCIAKARGVRVRATMYVPCYFQE